MRALWRSDRVLTATAISMLALLALSLVGLALDPRTITGAPAWLKPAKFAASIALFTLTLAWIFTYLPGWRRLRPVVGWVTSATFVAEMAIIALQAWRGTTSHFNVGTTLDLVLWTVMGIAILVQTLASVAVAYALWRQPFADRALGWSLRLGLTLSILGASTGGLMTRPTSAQLAEARASGRMTVVGAHTVGAPDGGPGVPGTGWSLSHGDLRIPHFMGLHALQALPLLGLALSRRRLPDATRVRMVLAASASYAGLLAILLWQALRGEALVRPGEPIVAAFAAWVILTAFAMFLAAARQEAVHVAS
jgi:hypothetical protein